MLTNRSRLAALSLAALAAACAEPRATLPEVTQAQWSDARAALEEMREQTPTAPFVEIVHVTMREPRSGRTIEARGAVAVDPRRAMRLILLGPGGATALDVWVTPHAWRFAVPSLDIVRRSSAGDRSADAAAGFPLGFFRWWFLEPLDGRLLTAVKVPRAAEGDLERTLRYFILRNGDATVSLRVARMWTGPTQFDAVRREMNASGVDVLRWKSSTFAPSAGLRAYYTQMTTGLCDLREHVPCDAQRLRVEIDVEEISPDPPDPTAFLDPDEEGGAR